MPSRMRTAAPVAPAAAPHDNSAVLAAIAELGSKNQAEMAALGDKNQAVLDRVERLEQLVTLPTPLDST